MRSVEPEIRLVARPQLDYDMIAEYLAEVGGSSWLERLDRDHEAGREYASDEHDDLPHLEVTKGSGLVTDDATRS